MIGVVICSYNSSAVILDCLDSILSASDCPKCIVVVDNDSPDGSVDKILAWAKNRQQPMKIVQEILPGHPAAMGGISLIRSGRNLGYAGAVNMGLRSLLLVPELSLFWVLNPDTIVPSGVATAYEQEGRAGRYGLFGSRIVYVDPGDTIQSDGGRVSLWTGICKNINQGRNENDDGARRVEPPDFVSGANIVVTRNFMNKVGFMKEDYFLYYEEVEWAKRALRTHQAIGILKDVKVLHHGGAIIGSGSVNRLPSPFALYFNFRNRMRFIRKVFPIGLPTTYTFSLLKIIQLLLKRSPDGAWAAFLGLHGLPPSKQVRGKLRAQDHAKAFGRKPGPSDS
jgi:GT2 family glycosyltransferase